MCYPLRLTAVFLLKLLAKRLWVNFHRENRPELRSSKNEHNETVISDDGWCVKMGKCGANECGGVGGGWFIRKSWAGDILTVWQFWELTCQFIEVLFPSRHQPQKVKRVPADAGLSMNSRIGYLGIVYIIYLFSDEDQRRRFWRKTEIEKWSRGWNVRNDLQIILHDFIWFWNDFGTGLWQFLGTNMLTNSFLFRACFQIIFSSLSDSEFRSLGLPTRGFRIERIAKIDFSWKSCLTDFGMAFCRFGAALGTVFWLLTMKNTLKTRMIFVMKLDPGRVIWWRRSWGYLGLRKT